MSRSPSPDSSFGRWRQRKSVALFALLAATLLLLDTPHGAGAMELFNVKYVERNGARLIATSNYNYAIASPKLASKNWRTVSVNGDRLLATTAAGQRLVLSRAAMAPAELALIERIRDEIATSVGGYSHTSTAAGSGFMGGTTTTTTTTTSASSYRPTGTGDMASEMSFNWRDADNLSVARSDLPYDWSRVFFNADLVTLIFRNGEVQMQPLRLLEPAQADVLVRLKRDVTEMQRKQAQQFSNIMDTSVNMVSSVFNNIMGQFPKPPEYRASVGGMFGDSFPFGPSNSPFSAASGWPFAGTGASAFASRR